MNAHDVVPLTGGPLTNSAEIAAIVDEFNDILTVIGGYAVLMQEDLGPGNPHQQDLAKVNASLSRAAAATRRLSKLAGAAEGAASAG